MATLRDCLAAAALIAASLNARAEPLRVVLDPGHGGSDRGVEREGLVEKDLALAVARKVQELSVSQPEISVVLTRQGDYPLSFDERRRVANLPGDGIFLSLHVAPKASGVKIFTPGPSPWAQSLAESLCAPEPGCPTETASLPLAPLHGVRLPCALVELDFLASPQAVEETARAVLTAIDRFRGERKNAAP